ncbi:MAG TPA: hypothetical protein VMC43_01960, partial [Candidatus Paceibacterota bacterium]|nr:hypothetical protein [Candidatus Paceibacterota bacterium]
MTDRELFIFTIADETPRFEKVFQAIPKEHRDYRPDPKSKTAMELAANMVGEAATLSELLQKGSFDFALLKRPEDKEPEEIAKLFTETLTEARKNASTMSDEDWRTE